MKTWIKVILSLIIIGIVGMVLVYIFIYNKSHPDFEKMKPEYTLAATDFYNSFITNRAESEKKYNGKVLAVSGTMTRVESTDSLVIAVFVLNQGMFGDEGIRCTMLPTFCEQARNLKPGAACTLKGYCTGFNDSDVILEQCSFIK
jgi:hypothetical protein